MGTRAFVPAPHSFGIPVRGVIPIYSPRVLTDQYRRLPIPYGVRVEPVAISYTEYCQNNAD